MRSLGALRYLPTISNDWSSIVTRSRMLAMTESRAATFLMAASSINSASVGGSGGTGAAGAAGGPPGAGTAGGPCGQAPIGAVTTIAATIAGMNRILGMVGM